MRKSFFLFFRYVHNFCYLTFSEKKELNKHVNTDHLKPQDVSVHEETKPFMCSTCGVNFARKIHLQRHTASVHEGKRPYMCNECGTSFAEKRGLELHISAMHDEKIANISQIIQMKRDIKSARRSSFKGRIFVEPHIYKTISTITSVSPSVRCSVSVTKFFFA